MEQVEVVKEGRIATSILTLYDNGIIVEPAGALGVAALE
jgi:threonine dehydratase